MARCDECSNFDLCEALEKGNGLVKVHPIHCGFYKPTADVAPKSEVAREIVGFIEGKIKDMEDHTPTEELNRAIGLVNWILLGVIDELKKKYTEGRE